jgi:hypothetical protein
MKLATILNIVCKVFLLLILVYVGRCMNVVQQLAVNYSAKMSYYLTKFDTVRLCI